MVFGLPLVSWLLLFVAVCPGVTLVALFYLHRRQKSKDR